MYHIERERAQYVHAYTNNIQSNIVIQYAHTELLESIVTGATILGLAPNAPWLPRKGKVT